MGMRLGAMLPHCRRGCLWAGLPPRAGRHARFTKLELQRQVRSEGGPSERVVSTRGQFASARRSTIHDPPSSPSASSPPNAAFSSPISAPSPRADASRFASASSRPPRGSPRARPSEPLLWHTADASMPSADSSPANGNPAPSPPCPWGRAEESQPWKPCSHAARLDLNCGKMSRRNPTRKA